VTIYKNDLFVAVAQTETTAVEIVDGMNALAELRAKQDAMIALAALADEEES
jgi:hypothetical protein